MAREIFLARTGEQEKFRQVLRTHQKNLRQNLFNRLLPKAVRKDLPFILLFYGEGGMGKTRLLQRLQEIAEKEQSFKGNFNSLLVDWEDKQSHYLGLQVGRDKIQPETVLRVLHEALDTKKGWGSYFNEYHKLREGWQDIKKKVDRQLKKPEINPKVREQVRKYGVEGIEWIIRQVPSAALLHSKQLKPPVDKRIKVSAEVLSQVNQLLQDALTPKEYQIYTQPQEKLAKALGKGIGNIAKGKPLIIFLDTYEIVDRPECDYTLRTVIQHSSNGVTWVIAGRSNLADSAMGEKFDFRGYEQDFPADRIYAQPLSEFSLQEIHRYFRELVPKRSLNLGQLEAIASFSRGIPLAIGQAAAMWKEGKPLDEIVALVPTVLEEATARQQIINKTWERFLVQCFSGKEREQDLRTVYALAMMRRPDVELLEEMLEVTDLEKKLKSLQELYSFMWAEGLRLNGKLVQFLREYLLAPVRRDDPISRQLNERAIASLELRLEQLTRNIPDITEQLQEESIAQTIADLVHHQFWQEEEQGWRYLVPRFVRGWQHNRTWALSVLEIVTAFSHTFSQEGQRRLKLFFTGIDFFTDPEETRQLLEELEKLVKHKYLDGEGEKELKAMLQLQPENFPDSQEEFAPVEVEPPQLNQEEFAPVEVEPPQLSQEEFASVKAEPPKVAEKVSFQQNNLESTIASSQQTVQPKPKDASYYNELGSISYKQGELEKAIASYQRAIELEPQYASPHNGLGNIYSEQGELDKAIASYQRAIELEPKGADTHYNLGNAYRDRGELDKAIASYQRAIDLDPQYASPYNALGNVYFNRRELDKAIASYQRAIELDSQYLYPHYNLGLVYEKQGKLAAASTSYQRAIALNPKSADTHYNLGNVYRNQGELDKAIASYQRAIELDPEYASAYNNLGNVYSDRGQLEAAIASYQRAIELDPEYASPHNNLGLVYEQQGKLEPALVSYQQAIQLDRNYGSAYNNLGWVYLLKNDLIQAKNKFEQAIDLDPNNYISIFNLGLVYGLQGNLDRARSQWQKGLAFCQSNNVWDRALGALYTVALGETEFGIAQMQNLIEEEKGETLGALRSALDDAEILARCPIKLAGIDTVVEMLTAVFG